MKKLIEKMREKKGFTLAELLIVVAIIAVLVAIAIPIFTTQLEKSREATDEANMRSLYAECVAAALSETTAGTVGDVTVTVSGGVTTCTATYTTKQQTAGWSGAKPEIGGLTLTDAEAPAQGAVTITAKSDGSVSIGTVSKP